MVYRQLGNVAIKEAGDLLIVWNVDGKEHKFHASIILIQILTDGHFHRAF